MKSNKKVSLLAEISIFAGFESEIKDAAEILWKATRKESGCEAFIFNIKKQEPNVILFFEIFSSEEAFEFHKTAAHTQLFLGQLKGKAKGDGPQLTFLEQFED